MIITLLIFGINFCQAQTLCQDSYMNLSTLDYQFYSMKFLFDGDVTLSFWFKYQKKFTISTKYLESTDIMATSNSIGQLLFRLFDSKFYRLYTYIQGETLKTVIISDKQKITQNENININYLEGVWQFKLYRIQNNLITHSLYNYANKDITSNQIDIQLDQTNFDASVGGYGHLQDYYQDLYFSPFQGRITQLNIYKGNPIIDKSCIIQNSCLYKQQNIIEDVLTQNDQIYNTNLILDSKLKWQSWFKLPTFSSPRSILQLRSSQSSDQSSILQSLKIVSINSLVLTTRSYENPLLSYDLEIQINAPLQWFFIVYVYDQSGQTIKNSVDIYSDEKTSTKSYSQSIQFYSGVNLYFYANGCQIAKLQAVSCFSDYLFQLGCHSSCQTCEGPTKTDCIDCNSSNNRILTNNNECKCLDGYFQFANQELCKKLSELNFFTLSEIESTKQNCKFGEFLVDQSCFSCPKSEGDAILYCGDCLNNQNTWQYNLYCTYDYVLSETDAFSPYQISQHEAELYLLNKNAQTIIDCVGCLELCNDDDCNEVFGQNIRCKKNYYYNNGQCIQCDPFCKECSLSLCLNCLDGYFFDSILQQCEQYIRSNKCGFKCLSCSKLCNYCEENYKISNDGINCELFEIQDCKNEINVNQKSSTYNFDYNVLTQPICAHCSTNNYNIDTQLCTNINEQSCPYSITISANNVCIDTLYQNTCSNISNCLLCLKDGQDFIFGYCVQCELGYYVDIAFGRCLKCPSECANCYTDTVDENRLQIPQIFYFKLGILQKFQETHKTTLPIKCLQCAENLELHNGICIEKCPSYCSKCEIINNKNVCVQCAKSQIQSDFECLECPSYCSACSKRSKEEIIKLNPLFDTTKIEYQKYSNKCYKPNQPKPLLSNKFQTVLQCQQYDQCSKILTLQINLYCSNDFEQNINNLNLFEFEDKFQTQFVNNEFLQQIDDLLIQQINIYFNFKEDCNVDSFKLDQYFQKYIFTIESVNLKFYSENQATLPKSFIFRNYTSIEFENMIFLDMQQFDVSSHFIDFSLKIKNCQATQITNQLFSFKQSFAQLFTIDGFKICESKFNNNLFSLNDSQLIIKDIIIQNSEFLNMTIFQIFRNTQFELINMQINDCKFINSQIFNTQQFGESTIDTFKMMNSQMFGSGHLLSMTADNQILRNFIIQDNDFFNQTSFIKTNGVDIYNFNVIQNTFQFGCIIQGPVDKIVYYKLEKITLSSNFYTTTMFFLPSGKSIVIKQFMIYQNIPNKDIIKQYDYFQNATVFLKGEICIADNLNITKGIGIVALIISCNTVDLQNIYLEQSQEAEIKLQPSETCLKQLYEINFYTPILKIMNSLLVQLNYLQILNAQIINDCLICIEDYTNFQQSITLKNSLFQNNKIIITDDVYGSILFVKSSHEKSQLNMLYNQANENILFSYSIDGLLHVSTVMIAILPLGQIVIQNNQIINNQALNTTNSIIYILATELIIQQCTFSKNNYDDILLILDKISNSFPDDAQIEQIQDIFSVISKGGNGQYISSNTTIIDCIFEISYAQIAAGIYIQTKGDGIITIESCQFTQLRCDLKFESYGGAIIIDGSSSIIQANINSCIFNDIMAKLYGGILFIKSSNEKNEIFISNLKINNALSLMGQLIYVEFPDQDVSQLSVQNIDWKYDYSQVQAFFGKLINLKVEYKSSIKSKSSIVATIGGRIFLSNFYIMNHYYFGYFSGAKHRTVLINNFNIHQTQTLLFNAFYVGPSPQNNDALFILNQIIMDTINTNPFMSTTYCSSSISFKLESLNQVCSKQSINRRNLDFGFKQTEDNSDCNQNLLQQYSYKDGWSYMDMFHIQQMDSTFLSQIVQFNNIAIYSSVLDMFESVFEGQDSKLGQNRNKSLQISHAMLIQNSVGGMMKFGFDSQETQRLLQTQKQNTFVNFYVFQVQIHINNVVAYSIASTYNYLLLFENYVVTNVTLFDSNMLDLYGIESDNQFFFFNFLVTDNIFLSDYFSNPVRLITSKQFINIIKTNFIILFNKRVDGTSLTNIAALKSDGLIFSINGVNYFKRMLKYRDQKQLIEEIYIKPYTPAGLKNKTQFLYLPSGQIISNYQYFDQNSETFYPLNYNVTVGRVNAQGELLISATGVIFNISFYWRILNQSNPVESTEFTFLTNKVITDSKNPVYIDDLTIDFDPYLSPDLFYQLSIQAPFNVWIYNTDDYYPYRGGTKLDKYELRVNIKTFQCQVGEYVYLNQCRLCDASQNYFQVLKGQTYCFFKDDASTISVKSYAIQMKPQYWRYRFNSTKIEYCYHQPENCLGGWQYGNPTCILGHIGALCESCDIYNIRGDGSYSISSQYNCGSCKDVNWNIVIIVLIAFFTLILGVITVKSNVDDTQEFILRTKMGGAFGIAPNVRVMSTILLKLLTNYAQIISSLFTFQLQLPPQIQQSTNSVGNPTQSMVYSLDCFLKDMSSLSILYLEFIWMISTPFFFISIIFIFFFIAIFVKMTTFNIGVITTTLIYFYIYMQPNLIQNMISQLSKREISEINFVQGNVSYLFDAEQHQQWIIFVILPTLLIIGFVIPFTLWYQVYKSRNSLEDIKVRRPWGFLYNEYKRKAFYWESIKLIQKQTIIIALNYYEDQVSIKASLVLLIVFLYHIISNKINPYYVFKLNRLDTMCTIVCSISIILCSTIYNAQKGGQYEIVWPFYIITGLLNVLYVLDLLIQILFSYLAQYQELFDKIKSLITRSCPYFVDRYPYIKSLLITKQQRQKIIKERWSSIKEYLFRKAKRTVRARKLTVIQSPESYYQRRGGVSSPSPLISYRDAVKGDMIDSLSQMNSSIHRKQNISNPTIKMVETIYNRNPQQENKDEYQVIEDPLSPQIVYISINPKTRSQLVQQ